MRKIKLLLGVILSICCLTLNAQNILKQYGYDKEFLTLSNGQFNEFFYNDTIVQVGTVLLNTITNKIVGFIDEGNNTYSFSKGDVSRWLSPDPHAEKYFSYSPYNYCINNPIVFIDPNGMDVYFDYKGNFLYDDGQGKDLRLIQADTYNKIRSESKDAAKAAKKEGMDKAGRNELMANKIREGLRGADADGNANSTVLTISNKEISDGQSTVDLVYNYTNTGKGEFGVNMYINTNTATIEFGGLQKTGKTGGSFIIEADKGAIIGNLHGHPDKVQNRADGAYPTLYGESKDDQSASGQINGPVYSVEAGNVYRSSSNSFTQYKGGRDAQSILRNAIEQKIPSNSPYFK